MPSIGGNDVLKARHQIIVTTETGLAKEFESSNHDLPLHVVMISNWIIANARVLYKDDIPKMSKVVVSCLTISNNARNFNFIPDNDLN